MLGCGPPDENVTEQRQSVVGKTQISVAQNPAYGPQCKLHVLHELPAAMGGGFKDDVCEYNILGVCNVSFDNDSSVRVSLKVDCSPVGKSVVSWWPGAPCGRYNNATPNGSASPECKFFAKSGVDYETGFHTCYGTNVKGFCEETDNLSGRIGKEIGAIGVVSRWNSSVRGGGPLRGGLWIAPKGYTDTLYYWNLNAKTLAAYKIPGAPGDSVLVHTIKALPTENFLFPSNKAFFGGQRSYVSGGQRKATWVLMYYDPSRDAIMEVSIPPMYEDENTAYSSNIAIQGLMLARGGITNLAVSPDGNEVTAGMMTSSATGDAPVAWFYWDGTSYKRGRVFQSACSVAPFAAKDDELIRLDRCPLGSSLAGFVAADGTYNPYIVGENAAVYKGVVDTRPPAPTLGFEVVHRLPVGGTYPSTNGCQPDAWRQMVDVKVVGTDIAHPDNKLNILCSQSKYPGRPSTNSRVTIWAFGRRTYPTIEDRRDGWIAGWAAPTTESAVIAFRPIDFGYVGHKIEYWQPKYGKLLFGEMTLVGATDEFYRSAAVVDFFYGTTAVVGSSSVCRKSPTA
jgi:hypothetical protein